jgi:hypothetical protein
LACRWRRFAGEQDQPSDKFRQTRGKEHRSLVKALEKEISALDTDIDDAVRGSPAWRAAEDLLSSVPGGGPVISRSLLAELPELGTLDCKKIAALAGLARSPASRSVPGTKLHWRRTHDGPHRPLHGRARCQPAQSGSEGFLSVSRRSRKAEDARPRRRRSRAPYYPQRYLPRQMPMEGGAG